MSAINVEACFVAPNMQGHLRLLSGIVLTKRPWKLFPSLKSARQRRRHERLCVGDAYHLTLAEAAGDGRLVNNGSHHGYNRLDYYRAQLIRAARRLRKPQVGRALQ
jgi:hypothetical protein